MEDVMYGVMLSAKTDILVNEPPVNASKKLYAPLFWLASNSACKSGQLPESGAENQILQRSALKMYRKAVF